MPLPRRSLTTRGSENPGLVLLTIYVYTGKGPEGGSSSSSTHASTSGSATGSSGPQTTPSSSLVLSTVYSTTIYTITSCAATVTDCPARLGSVTTDIISLYTTYCPGNVTPAPTPSASSQKTVELFTTVVVTSYVDYCPESGELTTITTSQTQVLPYPSGGASLTSAYIPMVVTTKTLTLSGETVTATLTIPSGAAIPTPYPTITRSPPQITPAAAGSVSTPAANVVVAGTTTVLVVPMQSSPVYPAVYPAGNATANAGIASGTVSMPKQSASAFTGGAERGAKGWSLGAGILALGAAMVML